MPVVINELVFKGQIAASAPGGTRRRTERPGSATSTKADRADLIEACVEQVLRILEEREER